MEEVLQKIINLNKEILEKSQSAQQKFAKIESKVGDIQNLAKGKLTKTSHVLRKILEML